MIITSPVPGDSPVHEHVTPVPGCETPVRCVLPYPFKESCHGKIKL